MLALAITLISAVALSLVTEAATGAISKGYYKVRSVIGSRRSLGFDVRKDGLYCLGEWSPARKLQPSRLITETTPEESRPQRFRIDHRESDDTQYCRVRQAASTYPEVLAIEHLRIRRPDLFDECDKALEGDSAVGWWTVGVFETMKQPDPNRPGSSEDIYGLAVRGLNEELGLQPGDYESIQVSWVGIYRPILRGHVVAIVKLQISREEAHARARTAHSGYEHASIDWVPLRQPLVHAFTQAKNRTYPDKIGSTVDVGHRIWLEQSRLGVLEAWRFRSAFGG